VTPRYRPRSAGFVGLLGELVAVSAIYWPVSWAAIAAVAVLLAAGWTASAAIVAQCLAVVVVTTAAHEAAHLWMHRRRWPGDGLVVFRRASVGIRISDSGHRSRAVALAGPVAGVIGCWVALAVSQHPAVVAFVLATLAGHLSSLTPLTADGRIIWATAPTDRR
jgi:hypothetical protein